jgi:hypothetical protein
MANAEEQIFYSGKGGQKVNSRQYYSARLHVLLRDDIQHALQAVDTADAEIFKLIATLEMQLYLQGY